ncbi:MAG TPA: cytochrome b [Rhodospirillaceae bacterium]|nr:cytochrome b [Rhodospirillaceae bacterium]HAA93199.1 cytochrome b [Rhodospirillaceae bacterium]HAT34071.1 cytochrome b [Rhodospirillaceae bacterium]
MEKKNFDNKVVQWVDDRLPVFSYMNAEYNEFPMPKNLNYFWNFGALATIVLVTMIVTGILLAMQYTPHTTLAFGSVERIMRDVNYGWLIRYIHANGASMFFIVVYIHIFRGLYYGSYKAPRELIWMLGVVILLLMMATAFMGYVLPWGQMSYWGAQVITDFFTAIPIVGDTLTEWLRGDFVIDNATLNRFFSLHYLLPFVIVGVVAFHVIALHITGSNNPDGIDIKDPQDTVPFNPYFTAKDSVGLGVFLIFWAFFVFYAPNYLGHPDNYIEANPLSTPAHIVPEWYFLPFYAILRSITFDILFLEAKLLGVIAMGASIMILFVLPWLDTSKVRSARYRPIFRIFFWVLFVDCIILGIVGAKSPSDAVFPGIAWFDYKTLGLLATIYYFGHFLVLLPILGKIEKPKPLPTSISKPVISGGGSSPIGAAAAKKEKA